MNWQCSELDTYNSEAEGYIHDLLWINGGTMDRKTMNHVLNRHSSRLISHPAFRSLVMHNAALKKLFFIARSPYRQVVGLTSEDAFAALKAANSELACQLS